MGCSRIFALLRFFMWSNTCAFAADPQICAALSRAQALRGAAIHRAAGQMAAVLCQAAASLRLTSARLLPRQFSLVSR
jgi:hypothetical protein